MMMNEHIAALLVALALGATAPDGSHAAPPAPDTAPTGDGVPFDNRQPALVLNLSVSTTGIFPSGSGGAGSSLTLGTIRMAAFNFLPAGSVDTNGGLLSIAQNPVLFALMGSSFGGDGVTSFGLPDLEGVLPVGPGTGPGLGSVTVGIGLGFSRSTLPVAQMPTHAHTMVGAGGVTGGTGGSGPLFMLQDSLGIVYAINTGGNFPGGASHGFLGEINMFAVANTGSTLPSGWTSAEGQVLSIAGNSALFSLLGTTYGGDGVTTFALPDFRGRTAFGVGSRPGGQPVSLGQQLGSETSTLTENELPSHTHGLPPSSDTTGASGGDGAFSNLQPLLGVNFLIATAGLFPVLGLGHFDSDTPFIGEIVMSANSSEPSGFAFADGRVLSIASNQPLFSLLGSIYGGDGETTFALPDLRGRSVLDEHATLPIGSAITGASTALSVANLPAHVHTVPEPSMAVTRATALLALIVVTRMRKTRG